MRILLLFDLPSVESYEKKEYRVFKQALAKNGYTMIQFSVYMKPMNGQIKIDNEIKKLSKYMPDSGILDYCNWLKSNIKKCILF